MLLTLVRQNMSIAKRTDSQLDPASPSSIRLEGSTETAGDGELPPRIIIHLPDGGVSLGEDTTRLRALREDVNAAKEIAAAASNSVTLSPHASAAVWADRVAREYTSALEDVVTSRCRLIAYAIGELQSLP